MRVTRFRLSYDRAAVHVPRMSSHPQEGFLPLGPGGYLWNKSTGYGVHVWWRKVMTHGRSSIAWFRTQFEEL